MLTYHQFFPFLGAEDDEVRLDVQVDESLVVVNVPELTHHSDVVVGHRHTLKAGEEKAGGEHRQLLGRPRPRRGPGGGAGPPRRAEAYPPPPPNPGRAPAEPPPQPHLSE